MLKKYFKIRLAFILASVVSIISVISASSMTSCTFSGNVLSNGLASAVNGFIVNKGDITTEVGEYAGGSFHKLPEQHAQIDFDTGTDLQYVEIDLTYFEDKQSKIYISGNYAQVNSKNYISERDYPKQDGYTPLYSIACDSSKIALAAMINGVVTTIIVNLDNNTAVYLTPYRNLYDGTDLASRTFISCMPVEMTDGGNTLVCVETSYSSVTSKGYYTCTAYSGTDPLYGNSYTLSNIATADTDKYDNFYCGIANNTQSPGDDVQVLVSAKIADLNLQPQLSGGGDDIVLMSVSPKSNSISDILGAYSINARAINGNIYCSNFEDTQKTDDYLGFYDLSESPAQSVKYDLGIKIDADLKHELSLNDKFFILNPSRTKVAILYKNVIYIMDLTDSSGVNSVKTIDTKQYGSSWDSDNAIIFIDDKTIIFNSGTTDSNGRMATVPKFIDVE
ncbi:MAG: hypothetical protein FWD71_10960 [Oscillospiraceae bacterium]|nr:hypothetical protein [Oscillospiraceae bacterium]